jgi:tetratricopeptide (TPR) repeat protein
MPIAITCRKLTFPIAVAVICCGGIALAQGTAEPEPEDADETIETITLDEAEGRDDLAASDAEEGIPTGESGPDGLILKDGGSSYRLVEDSEGDDWVEGPSEREMQAEELKRLFELYREALSNKDYREADTLAKRVVELSIRLNGLDSHDSAKAITNLGIAQHNNKEYEAALRNFLAAIDIVERIDDNLSPALINPLQGIAASQAALGRPDLARLSYERAVHVSHVNEGPHNADQVPILESMAELYISQGDWEEATDMQQHIFAVQSRKIDPLSMEIVPVLEKQAQWQHRLQRYHSERITWRQMINVIEKHKGNDSLELIPPLTNLGKSYLFVTPQEFEYQPDVSASSGESFLRRAVRIAEENPDATWETIEDAQLSLGDYYILSGRQNRAAAIYEETWNLLTEGGDPEKLAARRDHLETSKELQIVFPPKYYNSERSDAEQAPDSFETGTMSFEFTISSSGRVINLKHIETQPAELAEFSTVVGRTLRRMVYRPRIADAIMVDTPEMIYVHEFFYRPEDVPKSPAPPEAEPQTPVE